MLTELLRKCKEHLTNNEASRLAKEDMRSEDRYEVRRVHAKKRKEDNATRDGRDLLGQRTRKGRKDLRLERNCALARISTKSRRRDM